MLDLTLAILIVRLIALLVGMTFHEFMHNYVAYLMGDPTPQQQRRLTLNPLTHIYWPGFFMFAIIGFGILGTAPINQGLMNIPRVRWGHQLSRAQRFGVAVLAGPLGNLIVALVFAIPFRLLMAVAPGVLTADLVPGNPSVLPVLGQILVGLVWWNVLLMMFNLIPLGPLDGRYILKMFLPAQYHYQYDNFQNQYGMYILFGLILLSFFMPGLNLFGILIGEPTITLTQLLAGPEFVYFYFAGV